MRIGLHVICSPEGAMHDVIRAQMDAVDAKPTHERYAKRIAREFFGVDPHKLAACSEKRLSAILLEMVEEISEPIRRLAEIKAANAEMYAVGMPAHFIPYGSLTIPPPALRGASLGSVDGGPMELIQDLDRDYVFRMSPDSKAGSGRLAVVPASLGVDDPPELTTILGLKRPAKMKPGHDEGESTIILARCPQCGTNPGRCDKHLTLDERTCFSCGRELVRA